MIVGIETSTAVGSVAVGRPDGSVEALQLGVQRNHAKNLATCVAQLIDGRFGDVEAYALSVGPGSFTGLRVGLSLLKGLALVHPRPAVGVGSLEVAAARIFEVHPEASYALPIVDARREEVFAGLFGRGGSVALEVGIYGIRTLAEAEEIRSKTGIVAAGSGIGLDFGTDPPWRVGEDAAQAPSATDLVRLARGRFSRGEVSDAQGLEPIYLQVSGAEQKLGIRADLTTG